MTALYHASRQREDGADHPSRPGEASTWTADLRALWDRIAAHDFEPGHALDFAKRLAQDKSWTLEFARGAVLEYRRFCRESVSVC
ncbi:MAG: hypothetical protein EXR07_20835 [Acetobacteraceae bacterium]|nr:hypothetical protein [Acetobacteraceae bacterium]